MKRILITFTMMAAAITGFSQNNNIHINKTNNNMATVYDFNLNDKKGNVVNLSDYKGKVLLIVNTATGCGFTPQY